MQFFVCQHLTCKRQGAAAVFQALQAQTADAAVMPCGCLGRCGEGSNVLVLPDGEIQTSLTPERVSLMLQAYQQGQAWQHFWQQSRQSLGLRSALSPAKLLMGMTLVFGAIAVAFWAW